MISHQGLVRTFLSQLGCNSVTILSCLSLVAGDTCGIIHFPEYLKILNHSNLYIMVFEKGFLGGFKLEESLNKIALAIMGLYSDPIKDYIFPSIISFSSAILGAFAAFYAVNIQERNRIHIQNVDALNEAILSANDAKNTLMAIKSNYHNELSSNPYQRLLAVPRIILNGKPIIFQLSKLIFMTPSEVKDIKSKWQRIEYVDSLFSNYNHLLEIWKKRNDAFEEVHQALSQQNCSYINEELLLKSVDRARLVILSDLTEHVIMLTDDLLFELSCFLLGFPEAGKISIPVKIRKKYRKTLSISLPDYQVAVDLLSLSPELDYEMAAELHQTTTSELKNRYRRVYL
ncbi:hypothetical protein JD508_20620 [Aeromonas jandaei]|uniref:hypothetical protein n=1 Tax=Aeromonas jandaei TaxID=650 RepID=UPI00191D1791|nr:hypothetical protein [Aeromonas jandaei]MBL0612618.1 hypothetical protein [Aeromonas jandaei]